MRTYIQRIITLILGLNIMVTLSMCTPGGIDISETEFFITKEWRIKSLIGNGVEQTEEMTKVNNPAHSLEFYKLTLNEDFSFSRTGIDGQEGSGTWKLTAGLSQLVLFFDDTTEEHYLLLDLAVRRLEMRVLQDPGKLGTLDIRYILEPVK